MADGSFDDFDIDEDLDHDPELDLQPRRGRKRASAKPAPSPRDLAAEMALSLPTDRGALIRVAGDALAAYDAAVVRDAPAAAEDARNLYDATVYRYNDDSWFASYGGPDRAGYVIAAATGAQPGDAMGWNQKGVMRVEVDGVVAALACDGGFSLGGGWSWHALELHKPFFSPTGYWSYLGAPVIWGATLREAAAIWMRAAMVDGKKLVMIPDGEFIRTRPLKYGFLNDQAAQSAKPVGLMAFPF